MVRIDQSCSTIVTVRDTAIGIDWRFIYALPVIHLLTNLMNSRFNALHCPRSCAINIYFELPHFPFMFCISSLVSTITMKRLLFFLVFAAIGAFNPVEDFNEWDFQRRQDTLGIVNGSHSVSGAPFTPEPPVVLVKALKTLWTYIPFPEIPQLDPKPLNQLLDQALFELNDLDLRMFQHECADTHLFSYWKQLLRDNLAEVFQSHQIFKTDLENMRQLLTVFLNSSLQDRTFERPNRYKRSLLVPIVGTALGSELSRIFLRPFTAPRADKFSCLLTS